MPARQRHGVAGASARARRARCTRHARAPTSSPLLQQRFMTKATAPTPTASRIAPSSQAIRLRNKPANSPRDSTRQCAKQHLPVHQRRHASRPAPTTRAAQGHPGGHPPCATLSPFRSAAGGPAMVPSPHLSPDAPARRIRGPPMNRPATVRLRDRSLAPDAHGRADHPAAPCCGAGFPGSAGILSALPVQYPSRACFHSRAVSPADLTGPSVRPLTAKWRVS